MKTLLPFFLLLVCFQATSQTSSELKKQGYIFFLHNKFIEDQGLEGVHPEYGRTEYKETVQAFEKQGFIVVSERRPKNTEVKSYALKVLGQIDSLLKKGIPPSHITVIGTSKGGYIAMEVSSQLKNPEVNFVFVGCCSGAEPTAVPEFNFCGRILSIYEKSDVVGRSCQNLKNQSTYSVSDFKEIELHTGLKHGFLFKPLKEWVDPSVAWARRQDRGRR